MSTRGRRSRRSGAGGRPTLLLLRGGLLVHVGVVHARVVFVAAPRGVLVGGSLWGHLLLTLLLLVLLGLLVACVLLLAIGWVLLLLLLGLGVRVLVVIVVTSVGSAAETVTVIVLFLLRLDQLKSTVGEYRRH